MTTALRPLLLAVLLAGAALLALADSHWFSGPVVLTLSATHGVHATDPLVAGLAGLCLLGLLHEARATVRVRRPCLVLA